MSNWFNHPHRRRNVLTGEFVFVSPHRTQRPWQGRNEPTAQSARPPYDPGCYLCPGNARANQEVNPKYDATFVFTNDFAAFLPDTSHAVIEKHPLLRAETQAGACRVICFSPRHDVTLAQMSVAEIRPVVDVWVQQLHELGSKWRWVQIFENKGDVMGCSNPHPHGQIWASDFVPNEPAKETLQQQAWFKEKGSPLLLDYLAVERAEGARIVVENDTWIGLVPWWAVWPFETILVPKRPVLRLTDLNEAEKNGAADVLRRVLARYDNLFETSFPYSLGWHGAPTDDGDYSGWQLHAHIYPPLLRSATVKKFMVGYEMMAEAQRDITPEQAADRLRALSETHYLNR